MLGTTCVKCKNKQKKIFILLHPDTPIAANISQGQMPHNTNVDQYKSPHIPEVQNWKLIITLTVVPCKMRSVTNK